MRKIICLLLFILFIIRKDAATLAAYDALLIWSKQIFPVLFPSFILSDFLLSTGIHNKITKWFGSFYAKLFRSTPYGLFILLISFLSGTPTNAKNIKMLYDKHCIDENDVTRILSMSLFFNPFFILSVANVKVLLILWFSNLFVGILLRNVLPSKRRKYEEITFPFSLSSSIDRNIQLILSILGTITFFLVLSNLFPIPIPFFQVLFSGFLEVTNGLVKSRLYFPGNTVFLLAIFSFGGLSIFMQIKSILKDTSFCYKYYFLSRLLVLLVSVTFYSLTEIF